MSEAVRAVQFPESNSPSTRKYYRTVASERETIGTVQTAGGDNEFLFSGQSRVWDDSDKIDQKSSKQSKRKSVQNTKLSGTKVAFRARQASMECAPQRTANEGMHPYAQAYISLVQANRSAYLDAAALRLAELKEMMDSGQSDSSFFFPEGENAEFLQMTDAEFAARMAAIDTAVNGGGWFPQISGMGEGLRVYTPELASIQNLLAYSGILFLENLQSIGYLELRYDEFRDIASGNTQTEFPISPFSYEADVLWTNPLLGSSIPNPVTCANDVVRCWADYMRLSFIINPNDPSVGDLDLYAQLSAARYLTSLVQYAAFTMNPENNSIVDSTRFAIDCAHGTTEAGGSNLCSDHNPANTSDGIIQGYRLALSHYRALFGSSETDCGI